jgi:hypothetical protein
MSTRAPEPRSGSYRDPDLSDQWLWEAEQRALGAGPNLSGADVVGIILRLVDEVRNINEGTGR